MALDFIDRYFIEPIMTNSGYNLVNTLVYAVLLIFFGYIVFRAIRKLGLEIDSKFALGVFPYILMASILRSLNDIGIISTKLLVTPFFYVYAFSITFFLLVFSLFLSKQFKVSFHALFFGFGMVLAGILFTQLRFQNLFAVGQILALDLVIFILIFMPVWKVSLWNKSALFAQMFDAAATFVAVNTYVAGTGKKFIEQHVLPNILSNIAGSWLIFFVAKFVVVIMFLWAVDSGIEDKNFRNFLKLVVIMLGLGQGLRDLLMVAAFA
jgi:uncharacterized membrane protein